MIFNQVLWCPDAQISWWKGTTSHLSSVHFITCVLSYLVDTRYSFSAPVCVQNPLEGAAGEMKIKIPQAVHWYETQFYMNNRRSELISANWDHSSSTMSASLYIRGGVFFHPSGIALSHLYHAVISNRSHHAVTLFDMFGVVVEFRIRVPLQFRESTCRELILNDHLEKWVGDKFQ